MKRYVAKHQALIKDTQQRLIGRRNALRRTLAGDMNMLGDSPAEGGDEVDAAIATEQADLHSQMASFESRELAQIESALDRIQHGRYGTCDSCDKPIAPLRLKALPYATECIGCAPPRRTPGLGRQPQLPRQPPRRGAGRRCE